MTLLEVVIATVILAASLAVLGQLLGGARTAVARSVAELQALNVAESTMASVAVDLSDGFELGDDEVTADGWTVRRTVETLPESLLRRVTISVSPADGETATSAELTRLVMVGAGS